MRYRNIFFCCLFIHFITTAFEMRFSYKDRADLVTNPIAKKLFLLMDHKKTNLAVAADVTTKQQLLDLADQVGPYICILKTHIDIIQDFDWDLIEKLQLLAAKHNFLICEDRKFADIGNTVKAQYAGGIYKIIEWADIIIAHALPGPGLIDALQEVGLPKGRALLLLAQLSSTGNLITKEYEEQVIAMARSYPNFVIGFIAQSCVAKDPALLHITPGVSFVQTGDSLGQQYQTPHYVIGTLKSDIIIVGRGICQAPDILIAAQEYRQAAWQAYETRLQE